VARARSSVCSPRAVSGVCFCCRGGDPDKPVFGAHYLYSFYYYYTNRRRHRRRRRCVGFLGFTVVVSVIVSVSLGRRRRRRSRARASSPTANLRVVFYHYNFSLQSEKIARITSRDRLSSSRIKMHYFYFSILITTIENIIIYYYIILCVAVASRIILLYAHANRPSALVQCAPCVCRRLLRVDLSSIFRFYFFFLWCVVG